ncbi:protein NLRC3 [Scomber japonicus]|uniref:protein NLRC3 n=1 Tax=Scomber japonicus TaxID=13676 RepID=UPI002305CF28|nr:protein NLRC3 [Scomber japonicus]
MDLDHEVARIFRPGFEEGEADEEETDKLQRPPSSYGSMKSDSDGEKEKEDDEGEEEDIQDEACPSPLPGTYVEPTDHEETGLRLHRPESPETLFTITTMQTKPPGALVLDTRSDSLEVYSDDDEEDLDEVLVADSPEPPEPVEPDDAMQTEDGQPGVLHPEQDMPFLFKTIQEALSVLKNDELYNFKMRFYQRDKGLTLQNVLEGDILDFVDKIIEVLGQDEAVIHTVSTLESVNKSEEASALDEKCKRSLIRHRLKQYYVRKHQIIREGVVRAGKQNFLNNVYVEPEISICGNGGIDPFHEYRPRRPSAFQLPGPETFLHLNNLFRQQKADGQLVRTVVTTGLPGIGMTVSVGKFLLDWAELVANKELQFVFKLSFRNFWYMQNKNPPERMSILEMIGYYYPQCKNMRFLDEEGCKYLIIMDSFDCYRATLDWENAPVVTDNRTKAIPEVLLVNIFRGNLLRRGHVWVLGRRAAVTQIPSKFVDLLTEIQGFSQAMKDEYMTKRFTDKRVAGKVMAHYKRLPSIVSLTRHPFVSWMVVAIFPRQFRDPEYGSNPPRLTPFYINIMIVQMNRRLQFYYGKGDHDLRWTDEDKSLLTRMGKMALKMLEKNTSVFYEEDVKEFGLKLMEVTVLSGLCTEIPNTANSKRAFSFIHVTLQEYMAAMYVFTSFRTDGKNVLESGMHMPKIFAGSATKDQTKSPVGMVHCALEKTFAAPVGHFDFFLRFLCGMLSPQCHDEQLAGCLYCHHAPKVCALDEVQRILEKKIQTAPEDRKENLKECLRELIQKDE